MRAAVGERIVVRSRHQGEPDREGEVLEVRGPDGRPPYVVRWSATGAQCLFYPESDTVVRHDAGAPAP